MKHLTSHAIDSRHDSGVMPVTAEVSAGTVRAYREEASRMFSGAIVSQRHCAERLGVAKTAVFNWCNEGVTATIPLAKLVELADKAPRTCRRIAETLLRRCEERGATRLSLVTHGGKIAKEGGEAVHALLTDVPSGERRKELLELADAVAAALRDLEVGPA